MKTATAIKNLLFISVDRVGMTDFVRLNDGRRNLVVDLERGEVLDEDALLIRRTSKLHAACIELAREKLAEHRAAK